MTAERDFIRTHPSKKSSELIPLAKTAGLTITSRLIGKVRYYDGRKRRDLAAKASYEAVKVVRKAPTGPTKADAGRKGGLASANKRKVIPIRKLASSTDPAEHQLLVLADEIGYERSCELLDAWRESVRRVVAGL